MAFKITGIVSHGFLGVGFEKNASKRAIRETLEI
jgi:hypothetical protein